MQSMRTSVGLVCCFKLNNLWDTELRRSVCIRFTCRRCTLLKFILSLRHGLRFHLEVCMDKQLWKWNIISLITKDNFLSQLTTNLTNSINLIVHNRDEKTCTRAKYGYLHVLESKSKIQQQKLSLLTYLLMYGAEHFLRSCQLCSHSGNSQQF
jgi:hypothetical protein